MVLIIKVTLRNEYERSHDPFQFGFELSVVPLPSTAAALARNMLPIDDELCAGRANMTKDASRITHRLAFLETELSQMGDAASDAERDLRRNPTDHAARDRLAAIYDLARSVWHSIQELRRDLRASPG